MIRTNTATGYTEEAMDAGVVRHTVDEIYALPEGQRAELIDGVIYDMASPKRIHQELAMYLSVEISLYIRSHKGPCKVYPAPFAVLLFNDGYNYVEPDVSVICDPSKLDDRGCNGAPDWVVEIVTESSRTMDNLIKLEQYRKAGVREYWIVDPSKRAVRVYGFDPLAYREYVFGQAIPSNALKGLELDFAEFAV